MDTYATGEGTSIATVAAIQAVSDPALAPLFWLAERRGAASGWWGHVPFAHWIVHSIRPRVLVELGTHTGVSYAAFCNAVRRTGLSTRCFAVDTWRGDHQAGFYEEDVYLELREYHDQHFAAFSTMLRSTFDDARGKIADRSVDLLHIDGLHVYEAVCHDFETWIPKLSERAVVLFHDTNERAGDFGVWRLWSDLAQRFPSFEFLHSYGLGVLAVGSEIPPDIADLCAASGNMATAIRQRFEFLGERWASELRDWNASAEAAAQKTRVAEIEGEIQGLRTTASEFQNEALKLKAALDEAQAETRGLKSALDDAQAETRGLNSALDEARAETRGLNSALDEARAETRGLKSAQEEAQAETRGLKSALNEAQADARELKSARAGRAAISSEARELRAELYRVQAAHSTELAELNTNLQKAQAGAAELRAVSLQYEALLTSTIWQATWPIRNLGQTLPRPARLALRRTAKLIWWTATMQLPRRYSEWRSAQRQRRLASLGASEQAAAELGALPSPTPAGDAELPWWFDEELYLKINNEVRKSIQQGRYQSAYHHFQSEGRHASLHNGITPFLFRQGNVFLDYDEKAYLAANPDVAKAIGRGEFVTGLDHFLQVGYDEARRGSRTVYSDDVYVKLISHFAGTAALSEQPKYACLFAHWDRDEIIDDYVLVYLKELRRLGVDIFFITATAVDEQLEKIKPLCAQILIKTDAGRDFGSWYIALKTIGLDYLKRYEYTILANDSVYFPIGPSAPVFSSMEARGYNVWGITDSYDFDSYHLQSYFTAFDERGAGLVFPEYIRRYEQHPHLTKFGQIKLFELGLTRIAVEGGLRVGAYCSIDEISRALRHKDGQWKELLENGLGAINPTHDLWDVLIADYGCPMLKQELLRDNPKHAVTAGWQHLIPGNVPVNAEVIEAHLRRLNLPRTMTGANGAAPSRALDRDDSATPESVTATRQAVDGQSGRAGCDFGPDKHPRPVANGLSDGSLPNVAPRQAISLNRFEKALFRLNRDMNIIEIGPSYGPMAPRSGGWKTKIIDHIDRDGLIEKYKDRQDVGNIEPVDFIWRNGPLESAVPAELHGTFDACIASHVIEHAPDLVAFLSSIERLLTKGGFLSLAIPDKRYMFDCFQSLSTTADALDAHHLKRTRHSRRAAFENTAYQAFRNDNEATWYPGATGVLRIGQDVKWAKRNFDQQEEGDSAPYVDWHAWFFTPSSFELIMLELRELGLVDYQVDVVFPPSDCEFHVTLIKGAGAPAERDIQEIRLRLMEQIVVELGAQARDYSTSSPGEAGL